jgi:hypothetical protein
MVERRPRTAASGGRPQAGLEVSRGSCNGPEAVDADGKVVARDNGELTPAELDQLVAELAAGS